jgi:hypothetical protein
MLYDSVPQGRRQLREVMTNPLLFIVITELIL